MDNMYSSISLCHVPISPTHQRAFRTKEEQFAYFEEKVIFTSPRNVFKGRAGTIKIKGNYLQYINSVNYGFYVDVYNNMNKRFYFFIVDWEQVSRDTIEITIQLDVFQTWWFDVTFRPCFIERAMELDDGLGKNTQPEDFEIGHYVSARRDTVHDLEGSYDYILASTENSDSNGGFIGSCYTGFNLSIYKSSEIDKLSQYIKSLCDEGKADAIGYILAYPHNFIYKTLGDIGNGARITNITYSSENFEFAVVDYIKNSGVEYHPYNNKILTYPYNFITVKNSNSSNIILKREFIELDNGKVQFQLEGLPSPNCKFSLTPKNYCGRVISYEDSIEESSVELCSWNNDNYSNWLASCRNTIQAQSDNARNSYNTSEKVLSRNFDISNKTASFNKDFALANSIMSGVGSAIGGSVGGVANSGYGLIQNLARYQLERQTANKDLDNAHLINTTDYSNTINSLMASIRDASVQPNTCRGNIGGSGLDMARGTATFIVEQTQITPEYAKRIDMFWQIYGYKQNIVENPFTYIFSRPHWNYIKTKGCDVFTERMSLQDKLAFDELFDRGLTLWYDDDIRNYFRSNK